MSSSSSSSSGEKITPEKILALAKTHETRACSLADLAFLLGGSQYCEKDTPNFKAKYKGETVYITTALEFTPGVKYSAEAALGPQSASSAFDSKVLSRGKKGDPLSLYVRIPARSSGDLKVTFKENGKPIASKTVHITVE